MYTSVPHSHLVNDGRHTLSRRNAAALTAVYSPLSNDPSLKSLMVSVDVKHHVYLLSNVFCRLFLTHKLDHESTTEGQRPISPQHGNPAHDDAAPHRAVQKKSPAQLVHALRPVNHIG